MTDYCVLSELFELIKRLFLPLKGSKDVSPSTISRWICNVIKLAYADLSSSDLSFMKISAHEVRALSSSWAYWNSVPLDDVVPIALLPHFISEIWPQLDKIHHPWVLLWPLIPLLAVISLYLKSLHSIFMPAWIRCKTSLQRVRSYFWPASIPSINVFP